MSTTSLGENALANGVTVFGGFLFETIATFLFVLVILTVTSERKGNGAIAGLVIGFVLDGHDPCGIEHYWLAHENEGYQTGQGQWY